MTDSSARGIYRLDYLSAEGFPVYVAVTSDGRRVAERTRYPFETECQVVTVLAGILDEQDPVTWVA